MMKKIKFLETQTVEAQGVVTQTFNAGEVYELSMSSARRWLRRNVATEVQGSVKPTPKKRKPKPVTATKTVADVNELKRKPPITSNDKPETEKPAPVTSATTASESDDSDTGGRPVPLAE